MKQMLLGVMLIGCLALGCQTKSGTGALAGGAGGAGLGAIIGHQSGHTAEGALIGGAVGAIGGAVVGNEMDKADERQRERELRESDRHYYGSAAERDYDRRHVARSSSSAAERVTKFDVIDWTRQGVKDEIIIDRIERSGTMFHLTAADESELRDEGVSPSVIRVMRNTPRR